MGRKGRGQTKRNCGLHEDDSSGDDGKWLDSKCSLKVELTGLIVLHH